MAKENRGIDSKSLASLPPDGTVLPSIKMLDPNGFISNVVVVTDNQMNPDNNLYRNQVLENKLRKFWLFTDHCPLQDGANADGWPLIGNESGDSPCREGIKGGPITHKNLCKHLAHHLADRQRHYNERMSELRSAEERRAEAVISSQSKHTEALTELLTKLVEDKQEKSKRKGKDE